MRRTAFLLLACFVLASCVISPLSRTPADSTKAVTLNGYALSNTATITIKAINQNTGSLDTLGIATFSGPGIPHTTSGGTTYTLYPWTFKAGVIAANYWSPQSIVGNLKTTQGHLELFASDGGANYSHLQPRCCPGCHGLGPTSRHCERQLFRRQFDRVVRSERCGLRSGRTMGECARHDVKHSGISVGYVERRLIHGRKAEPRRSTA